MKALELIAEIQKYVLRENAQSKSWVVDGGFFKGAFALKAIKHLKSVQCIGFEPNRKLFEEWQESNLSKNEYIVLENLALGSQCREASYFSNDSFPATNSLLPRPLSASSVDPYYPSEAVLKEESKSINMVSLDQYLCSRSVSEIFLLKLDLQGGELEALRGAENLLSNGSISIIFIEAVFVEKYENQPLLRDLWNFLADFGYRLHSLHDIKSGDYDGTKNVLRKEQLNQCDALFLSQEVLDLMGV